MEQTNEMMMEFDSRSCNESFARVAVAAFMTQLNPTLEEVADVKTAVSEAITNAIIHAYDNQVHKIRLECRLEGKTIEIAVTALAKGFRIFQRKWSHCSQPAGAGTFRHGICIMEAFMDELSVESRVGRGQSSG